jgi:hypothetical protein
MDKKAFYQNLKELQEYLVARQDEQGISLLSKALDTLSPRGLADVSEEELMGFLHSIEEVEGADGAQEWVSTSAVRTDIGLITRSMIETEISRRSREL